MRKDFKLSSWVRHPILESSKWYRVVWVWVCAQRIRDKTDYDENPNINTQTPQVHYASSTPRRKQQDYGVFWPWAKKRNANSKKQNSNPSATIKWYYLDSNKTKRGPLSTHAIQDLLKSQYIKLDSYVWNTEMCTWKRACQVAPLQKVILRTQAARERETK